MRAGRLAAGQYMVLLSEDELACLIQYLMWARVNTAPVPEREDEPLMWAECLQSALHQ